ncbi:MAG: FAD:protein FMN transferase [Thermoanaerobaculia bacterium]|nr:FAD:protein FMN transferase [Thermoanaerobaculia bacterium]
MYETESQLQKLSGAILLLILLAGLATACTPQQQSRDENYLTRSRILMGTPLTITVQTGDQRIEAVEEALDEVARIEASISTWRDDSVFAKINREAVGTPVEIDPEIASLLARTIEWSEITNGAFDPAAGRVLFAWDLRGDGRVPTDEEIENARALSGAEHLRVDLADYTATREVDLLIEEGGFGKGWALDHAAEILRASGVEQAVLDFGGQVTIFGAEPIAVGIAHPEDRMRPAVELQITKGSIATSSGSQRSFESDGRRYSHLFDPRTGRALPPRGSVTVIHETGLDSDILATALYVLGPDEGLEWAEARDLEAIFIVPSAEGGWDVISTEEADRSVPIRSLDREFKIERNQDD